MSSNPGTVNWMDIFSYLFVVKCALEKMKINEKEIGVGLFFLKKHQKAKPAFPSTKQSKCKLTWPNRPIVLEGWLVKEGISLVG